MGTLSIGYFSGHNWGRALWLFMQANVIAIPILVSGHLWWYAYVAYIILSGIIGGMYKNIKQNSFISG
jgi:hypothetical protein